MYCIMFNMKQAFINLLDWIYKKKCYFCGHSKESLKMCTSCYEEMEQLPVGKNREIDGAKVYCAGVYEQNIQKLIRGLKYHNQRDLAYFQAKFMHDYWKNLIGKHDSYQVIPIPLYPSREKQRKYNHMTLVAEEFCKLTGYSLNLNLVKRIKDTLPQYKLSKSQRMENLDKAFEINKEALKTVAGENILLLDDICTTGATFENIIIELKKHEISNVSCFATTTPFNE